MRWRWFLPMRAALNARALSPRGSTLRWRLSTSGGRPQRGCGDEYNRRCERSCRYHRRRYGRYRGHPGHGCRSAQERRRSENSRLLHSSGLSGPAIKRIEECPIEELIVTNTIPLNSEAQNCKKIKSLSVAHLIGEAIRRTHEEESISSLFVYNQEEVSFGNSGSKSRSPRERRINETPRGCCAAARFPAILYGPKTAAVALALDKREFSSRVADLEGSTWCAEIRIRGAGG